MPTSKRRNISIGLWVAQSLLAAIFLMAGVMKLIMPADDLTRDTALSPAFLRFIGACEVLGALGLMLPGITGLQPRLTPIASGCLAFIMAGAVIVTLAEGGGALALWPLTIGLLLLAVLYGRIRLAPTGVQQHRTYAAMSFRGYVNEAPPR